MAVLEMQALTRGFDGRAAVDTLTTAVEDGDVFAHLAALRPDGVWVLGVKGDGHERRHGTPALPELLAQSLGSGGESR